MDHDLWPIHLALVSVGHAVTRAKRELEPGCPHASETFGRLTQVLREEFQTLRDLQTLRAPGPDSQPSAES
jgi:hypothetical protein